jgi:hypothetical protein
MDVPLPLGSWTVPSLSHQLFTSHNCNSQLTQPIKVKVTLWPTVSQPVLVSSTNLGPKTGFLLLSDSSGFVDVRLPYKRMGLLFGIAAGLASAVIIGSESHRTHDNILLFQIQDSTNLEGQVPIFISPRKKVAQLHPHALGSLFVTSYDFQGYGGYIQKSKLCYNQRSVSQSVLVSSTHLGLMTGFLLLSNSCGFVDVGRSLWRENGSAVYNCCWSLPAHSFLDQSLTGLLTIFYCLRFETLQPGGPGPRIYIPPNRVTQLYPQALGSVFVASCDSQQTYSNPPPRGITLPQSRLKVKVKVKVTLRLAVYRQSVCLGVKPLETHDQRFFFLQLNPCDISPYVTSSLMRRWVCLLWMCLAFCQVYISHI